MVKRLRIQLFLGKALWETIHYTFPSMEFNCVAVRSSLATLFKAILKQAHVELAIWAPEIDPGKVLSDDEFRRLKRIMIAFTPLARAMTLTVTMNGALEASITEKRRTELRAAIRRHAKIRSLNDLHGR